MNSSAGTFLEQMFESSPLLLFRVEGSRFRAETFHSDHPNVLLSKSQSSVSTEAGKNHETVNSKSPARPSILWYHGIGYLGSCRILKYPTK